MLVGFGFIFLQRIAAFSAIVRVCKILFTAAWAIDELLFSDICASGTDRSFCTGGFLTKLADLRSYGLLTSRGTKVTDLGKKLTFGISAEEKNEAFKEALLNIPLWKELYSKFGKTLPTSNFWAKLTEITGLEAPDAQKVEENVRNAYLADFQYVKEETKPKTGDKNMDEQDNINKNQAKPPEGLEQLTLGSDIKVWLPKGDMEAAKKAIQLIRLYSGIEEEG